MTVGAPPPAARAVRPEWRRLSARPSSPPVRFDPALVADLPEPARRWLTHAIAPGTPLWSSVRLTMRGTIRLGTWRPFRASQVLAPPEGYIWAATARVLGLPVVGYDRLSGGTAEMRWRLLGLLPLITADGPDVATSAGGRLAAEGVVVPTTFRAATWTAGDDPDTAVATWRIGPEHERVELHLAADGRLLEVRLDRWGNPDGAPYGRHPFGVAVEEERTFDGVTIPAVLRAGWWWGTDRQDDGEFFRARITDARFC